jgi:protein O-GlcNAc transferase
MTKPGRNDPCPCGSGRKYKQCCAPRDNARTANAASNSQPAGQEIARTLELAWADHQAGRVRQAEAAYRQVLANSPRNAHALHLLGILEAQRQNFSLALDLVLQAIKSSPNEAAFHSTRGNILMGLGRPSESILSYDNAARLAPGFAEPLYNRGNALRALQRHADAIASYDRALALRPGYVEALNNRGDTLLQLQRYDEAVLSFDRALALNPRYAEALNNRGSAMRQLKRYEDAAESYGKLAAIYPDFDYALGNLFDCRLHCCDWAHYGQESARITQAVSAGKKADIPFRFLAFSQSPAAQLQCARTFVADRYRASATPLWTGERYSHERIRVAYLSADFHNHATAYLMAELFETHDRQRFETTAISFGPDSEDEMRGRLRRSFDHFIEVRANADAEVANMLRQREIDIAVDLKGHTTYGRTGILAHRPAPIQVSYLGYPGSMGAPYVDYIVADGFVISEADEKFYDEKIVYLPDSYQVNDSKRAIAETTPGRVEAGLPEKGFVFCCFNNSYKIAPDTFDIWMRLLNKVEGGVLWLLAENSSVTRNLRAEAERRGVSPERLVFAAKVKLDQHLARHRLADLFLDTLPYNAHTTASDALWTGLPVLTCAGSTFAGRVAASLLHAVGLPELVTRDLHEYEELALKLAQSPAMLSEIAARLTTNRATAPLFDTHRFRRHLESAYITMWERYQRGEPAAAFKVQPIA